jgi:hypothetical protein
MALTKKNEGSGLAHLNPLDKSINEDESMKNSKQLTAIILGSMLGLAVIVLGYAAIVEHEPLSVKLSLTGLEIQTGSHSDTGPSLPLHRQVLPSDPD